MRRFIVSIILIAASAGFFSSCAPRSATRPTDGPPNGSTSDVGTQAAVMTLRVDPNHAPYTPISPTFHVPLAYPTASWLNDGTVTYASSSGLELLSIPSGTVQTQGVEAFLAASDPSGRKIAVWGRQGLSIRNSGGELHTVLTSDRLEDIAEARPAKMAGIPTYPVVSKLEWSPQGDLLAILQTYTSSVNAPQASRLVTVGKTGQAAVLATWKPTNGENLEIVRDAFWLPEGRLLVALNEYIPPDEGDVYFAFRAPEENTQIQVSYLTIDSTSGTVLSSFTLPWYYRPYAVVGSGTHLLLGVWPAAKGVDRHTVVADIASGRLNPVLPEGFWPFAVDGNRTSLGIMVKYLDPGTSPTQIEARLVESDGSDQGFVDLGTIPADTWLPTRRPSGEVYFPFAISPSGGRTLMVLTGPAGPEIRWRETSGLRGTRPSE